MDLSKEGVTVGDVFILKAIREAVKRKIGFVRDEFDLEAEEYVPLEGDVHKKRQVEDVTCTFRYVNASPSAGSGRVAVVKTSCPSWQPWVSPKTE
jgi:DNA helicase TIP49 (TBP-interacting protein)